MKDLLLTCCVQTSNTALLLTYNNGMTIYVKIKDVLGEHYDWAMNQFFCFWTIEDDGLTLKYGKFEACVREIYREHLEKLQNV